MQVLHCKVCENLPLENCQTFVLVEVSKVAVRLIDAVVADSSLAVFLVATDLSFSDRINQILVLLELHLLTLTT